VVPGEYVTADPLTRVMSAVAVLGVTRIASPVERPVPVGSANLTRAPFEPEAQNVELIRVTVNAVGAAPTVKVRSILASVGPTAPSPSASCHIRMT